MASQQTIATQKITANIERSLEAACVSFPEVMIGCILDDAQDLVNEHGYCWDVALAKACQVYPATRYAANYLYS